MKFKDFYANEEGSILVIALIMLSLLTVLGLMSTTTTSIDLQIARNERIHKENFNMAEAAAMRAAQRLIDEGIVGNTDPPPAWVTPCDETAAAATTCGYEYRDPTFWFDDLSTLDPKDTVIPVDLDGDSVTDTYYTAQYNGEFAGSSLGLGISNVRLDKFTCYGLYRDPNRGEVLIEIAMTKATF